jgi:hypothetical protein
LKRKLPKAPEERKPIAPEATNTIEALVVEKVKEKEKEKVKEKEKEKEHLR